MFSQLSTSEEPYLTCRAAAELHYTSFIGDLNINGGVVIYKGFMAGLLTSLAGCPDRLGVAIHLLGQDDSCVTNAFALLMQLVSAVRQADSSAMRAATRALSLTSCSSPTDAAALAAAVRSVLAPAPRPTQQGGPSPLQPPPPTPPRTLVVAWGEARRAGGRRRP